MISLYARTAKGIVRTEYKDGGSLPNGTVWIDIDRAEKDEIAQISHLIRRKIPALREVRLIDQSQQYYTDRNALYLMTPIVVGSNTQNPTAGVMMFILTKDYIITLRKAESRAINNFAERLMKSPELLETPADAFVSLVDAIIDRLADLGEKVSHEMEQVSRLVFMESLQRSKAPGNGKADTWRKVLQGLGATARLNHRILNSLSGLERMITFLDQPKGLLLETEHTLRLGHLRGEIQHLTRQSDGMVSEANFLLDAIVGAISIEQNNVIKIFSMVSVILMPPTMIASIYGMNFAHMPELGYVWAYPAVLLLMLCSAILPWWWFKRSGWF